MVGTKAIFFRFSSSARNSGIALIIFNFCEKIIEIRVHWQETDWF